MPVRCALPAVALVTPAAARVKKSGSTETGALPSVHESGALHSEASRADSRSVDCGPGDCARLAAGEEPAGCGGGERDADDREE
jgi:uncharacterized low-complexity protein